MTTAVALHETTSSADAAPIRPFKVHVPEAELTELRRRINNTKWPERETVNDATQGVQLATTQALARYWGTEYDWRKCEARLNALPQFISEIDGLDIHFIHVRSKHENALPIIVTHGWPGSIVEQLKIIDPLTNPTAHGGKASDAFDVVIPSMPGFGFSGKPTTTGWGPDHIARAWVTLMKRLGYGKFVAQGGDWAQSLSISWACKRHRSCLEFTATCLAFFQVRSTRRLSLGHRRHRACVQTRRSHTSACSSCIKRASLTGSRWACGRRHCMESRIPRSAWRHISLTTTHAATR